MPLGGIWENEYGSVMEITVKDGRVEGLYSSHTGETGTYRVVGLADPNPTAESQTFAFVVFWCPLDGHAVESGGHSVSAFAGQLQTIDGEETLTTTWLLARPTSPGDNWTSVLIDKSIFRRRSKRSA